MSLSFKRLADTGNTYIAEFVSCCGFESRLQSLQKNEIELLVKLSRYKNQQQPKQSAIKRDIKLKLLFDVEFISLEKEKSQKLDSFFLQWTGYGDQFWLSATGAQELAGSQTCLKIKLLKLFNGLIEVKLTVLGLGGPTVI